MEFDGQREGEKVEFIFRRHMSVTRKGLIFALFMIVIGLVPSFIWGGAGWTVYAWMGFCLVGFLGYGYTYMLWYFSYYLVTNQRLRQVMQKGLFKRSVVDLGLDKIHSISFDVSGILPSIFGYGTLLIQTQVGDLTVSSVGHPEQVYNKLQNAVRKAEKL